MLDVAGLELTQDDRELLMHPIIGGVILFARNYESRAQVSYLCKTIRALRNPPLLIAVDQEGGRVQRFREEFSSLPSLGELGKIYQNNPVHGKKSAFDAAVLMASEVLSVGVDLSFAPVLDLNMGVSTIIGDRSFGSSPDVIIDLASSYIDGLNQAGMAATGKHFPGHGSIAADSHLTILNDDRDLETILHNDLRPFTALASKLGGIMPAHIVYPQIDSLPAGFSPIWLKTILRERLGFKGLIFSDDLSMKGASIVSDYSDRARAALEAGCDMVLVCNDRPHAIEVVEALESRRPSSDLIDKIKSMYGKLKGNTYGTP